MNQYNKKMTLGYVLEAFDRWINPCIKHLKVAII